MDLFNSFLPIQGGLLLTLESTLYNIHTTKLMSGGSTCYTNIDVKLFLRAKPYRLKKGSEDISSCSPRNRKLKQKTGRSRLEYIYIFYHTKTEVRQAVSLALSPAKGNPFVKNYLSFFFLIRNSSSCILF